jgi:hypothetical protein
MKFTECFQHSLNALIFDVKNIFRRDGDLIIIHMPTKIAAIKAAVIRGTGVDQK